VNALRPMAMDGLWRIPTPFRNHGGWHWCLVEYAGIECRRL